MTQILKSDEFDGIEFKAIMKETNKYKLWVIYWEGGHSFRAEYFKNRCKTTIESLSLNKIIRSINVDINKRP